MRIKSILLLSFVVIVSILSLGCKSDGVYKEDVEIFQECLKHKTKTIDSLKSEVENLKAELEEGYVRLKPGELVHTVLLKYKDDITENEIAMVLSQAKRLESIEVVNGFALGAWEDVGDNRSLKEFDLFLQLTFASKADLKIYDNDPIHSDVRSQLKSYIVKVSTFDYFVKN